MNNFTNYLLAVRGIIIHQNKVFLVQHAKSPFFSLPGGKLEGDEALKTGVERELFEELGVKADVGELACVQEYIHQNNNKNNIEFFFIINNGADFLNVKGGTHIAELKDFGWFDIDKLPNVMPEFLTEMIPNIARGKCGVQFISRR